MQTQIIKPATGRFEGAWLLLVCVVVLAVCGALILQRHTKLEVVQLQPYQISAFADLNKSEQGIFTDLYAAALELQTVYRDSKSWLTLEDLRYLSIPPFAQSAMTEMRGAHQWSAVPYGSKDGSDIAYFG